MENASKRKPYTKLSESEDFEKSFNAPVTNVAVSPRNREYIRRLKKATAQHFDLSRLSYYDFFNLLERELSNENEFVKKLFKK
jgi:hypothetical protein